LALFAYVTTDNSILPGAVVRYKEVMLELGPTRHEYVPYYGILPTAATKGAYNYSDLNRVEWAVKEIATSLSLNLSTKTDWGPSDIPKESDMRRYLSNVVKIRAAIPELNDIPLLPNTMVGLNYETANNIEKILLAAKKYIETSYKVGELFCGEV
jgi:hypothetical protein